MLAIAVAGCGPGGLAAALFLHRAGHRLTLFERFDTPRPLGSALILQPAGLAVLASLGLSAPAIAIGARIERLFGRAAPSGRVVLDVRYADLPGEAFGVGIHRAALFGLLFDAVAGEAIPIETGREIVASDPAAGGCRDLRFADGAIAGPFDLVVDALGTQSPLAGRPPTPLDFGALWATLDWEDGFDAAALDQRYRRARKMVGILPIGRMPGGGVRKAAFFWSLRGADLARWRAEGLAPWKDEVRALWPEVAPLLDRIVDADQMTFARYCHRTLRRPVEPGLVHLGDAWHSTSPQLGQGANMALLDAAALDAALATGESIPAALARYQKLRRRHVRLYQLMSYAFTPFYQSHGRILPFLRDHMVGPLSRVPPVPRLLAAIVAGALVAPLAGLPFGGPETKARAR